MNCILWLNPVLKDYSDPETLRSSLPQHLLLAESTSHGRRCPKSNCYLEASCAAHCSASGTWLYSPTDTSAPVDVHDSPLSAQLANSLILFSPFPTAQCSIFLLQLRINIDLPIPETRSEFGAGGRLHR